MPYQHFTVARLTEPDAYALLSALRAINNTIGVQHDAGTNLYKLDKESAWTPSEISQAQAVLEGQPTGTPQLLAQAQIDNWPIAMRAFALTLIDQLNVLRAALPTPLPAITPAQAVAAIRAKAGTL